MNPIDYAISVMTRRAFLLEEAERQGITIPELAAKTNVGVATIRNLFEGKTFTPSDRTFIALMDGLGYKLSYVRKVKRSAAWL